LASFRLKGKAQLWFQILLREGREIGWPEFKERVFALFGPTQFYDPFGELTKLQVKRILVPLSRSSRKQQRDAGTEWEGEGKRNGANVGGVWCGFCKT